MAAGGCCSLDPGVKQCLAGADVRPRELEEVRAQPPEDELYLEGVELTERLVLSGGGETQVADLPGPV